MKAYLFPGQGSQRSGMGEALFEQFPDLTATADAILGYSIRTLCLRDPEGKLGRTEFTQPALYVVNALSWRHRARDGERPDFVAGHSLGEYNALECAGVFRFEDGLRLVQQRGALMSQALKGGMAAIIGPNAEAVATILRDNGLASIDIANLNAPTQTIISGLVDDVRGAQAAFEQNQAMFIPLNVSGAFHSRYMRPAAEAFARFLAGFLFAAPRIPVIANATAQPYEAGQVARNLEAQLSQPVRWLGSVQHLLRQGVTEFVEVGPGDVLTKLVRSIKAQFKPDAPVPTFKSPAAVAAPASVAVATPASAQDQVLRWNRAYPVGTRVRAKGYDQPLLTKTEAMVLFGHRAAIYMQDYNGYFALDEIEPVSSVASVA